MYRKVRVKNILLLIYILAILLVSCKSGSSGINLSSDLDLIQQIRNVSAVPIYLPTTIYEKDAAGQNNFYDYRIFSGENFYQIEIIANKNKSLKDIPISEATILANIIGEKNPTFSNSFAIPEGSEKFELTEGITAYKNAENTQIWWQNGKWQIYYTGLINIETLRSIQNDLLSNPITIATQGTIKISSGNKLSYDFIWECDGYYYHFLSNDIQFEVPQMIKVINSYKFIE